MTTITKKELQKIEEYYYWSGYKSWYPFPKKLKTKLLRVYGKEPLPNTWTEEDIWEGSRKIILEYFDSKSN